MFCWFMLWWFACDIPNFGASEYSTADTSNSSVGKYYVVIKQNKFKSIFYIPDSSISE
jgi:hypothetical protein